MIQIVAIAYAIFPLFIGILWPDLKDLTIAVHEFVSESLAVIVLLLALKIEKQSGRRFSGMPLILAALTLFLADSLYSYGVIHNSPLPQALGSSSEALYTVFAISIAGFFVSRRKIILSDGFGRLIFSTAFIGHLILTYKFILHPFYTRENAATAFNLVNSSAYALATSIIFAFVVPYALRTTRRAEYWFLQGLLLFLVSDFAIRYQSAFVTENFFSMAEFGWAIAAAILCIVFIKSRRNFSNFFSHTEQPAEIVSVRVMLALAISGANLILLLGVVLIDVYRVRNAFHLTNALFLIYGIWLVSHSLAIRVSDALTNIRTMMFSTVGSDFADGRLMVLRPIENRVSLAEVDQLIAGYNGLVARTNALALNIVAQQRVAVVANLAAQVAHDIRSPLAALDSVTATLAQLPEEKRLIVRAAVGRIRDIANNLVAENRHNLVLQSHTPENNKHTADGISHTSITAAEPSVELLSVHLDSIITEKRLQYRSVIGVDLDTVFDKNSYGLFSKIQTVEFKRVLSNIINNAYEALADNGRINITLRGINECIEISIVDNGPGIPSEVLPKLTTRGATFGKPDGSGLGLYHAKHTLERWGGRLHISSMNGSGTAVRLILPKETPPPWFVEQLTIKKDSLVVVLDDDSSIHQIWKGRLESLRAADQNVGMRHLSVPKEFKTWVLANMADLDHALFLVDYELLGYGETGLDLVEILGIGSQSILVTSRFEEEPILKRAVRLGMRVLPKGMAGIVPMRVD